VAILKFFVFSAWLLPVFGIAVEHDFDAPLDMRQKWRFIRGEDFYLQHRCGDNPGNRWAKKIGIWMKKTPAWPGRLPVLPLQVRLMADAAAYRQYFKFSRERHAHYNARLNLVTAYCGISPPLLREQIILQSLEGSHLRLWQKVFVAEVLAQGDTERKSDHFSDSADAKPVSLQYLLLSNHRPDKPERAAMRQLARLLSSKGKLREFIQALVSETRFDDTGLEVLETWFPESLPNNTLPERP
jgi:hypothetical protein